jgi:PAS domain S-box-containing protein
VLLWLVAGTVVAIVAVLATGGLAVGHALRSMERGEEQQSILRARELLRRQFVVRAAVIREYAWWTETWQYLDRTQGPAASRFIATNFVDWLPRQYGDRFIGLWTLDRRRAFVWEDSSARGLAPAFETPERFDLIAREKSAGGLVRAPQGLFLVSAAVVVRTEDVEGTGPWHGYVVTARPVETSLLREWGDALGEHLELLPPGARETALLGDTALSRHFANGDSVEGRFVVRDLYGAPAAIAVVTVSRSIAGRVAIRTAEAIGATALLSLLVIAVVTVVGKRSVLTPLEAIASALVRMQASGRLAAIAPPGGAREWDVAVGAFNETVRALHESEEEYRTLFEQAADALFVVEGSARTVADANPSAERLAGLPRAELLSRSLTEFLGEPAANSAWPGTLRWHGAGGVEATVEVRAGADGAGGGPTTLVAVHDVSEREALDQQLRQAQKMEVLGRLAGGIAHDFNNLLGAIVVSTGLLRDEIAADDPAQDSVRTIEHSARRGAELTSQLLRFSRREPMRREPFDAHAVLNGVRALCERTFGHAVAVVEELGAEGAVALGDAGQLEQALLNFCLNARDSMAEGGTLTLSARVADAPEPGAVGDEIRGAGPWVVLGVADTGAGMTHEVVGHLFEPFFTTKERGKGTGLGLATAYGIVQAHGGAMRVQTALAKGSRFEIWLPRAEGVSPSSPASRLGSSPRGTESILVVDDEVGMRYSLDRALSRLGYTVVQAASGEEGVARFTEKPFGFAIVLLDVLMPGIGGVAAFRAMRALRPDARIVIMTGFASAAETTLLRSEGAAAIVPKPFTVPQMALTVRAVLDGRPAPALRS